MLIQNAQNATPAPQMVATQVVKSAGDGASVANAASPPEIETKSDVKVEASKSGFQQAAEPTPSSQPSMEQLKNVVENINKVLKQANRNLEFSVDKDTSKQVVKLVDSETGDVIRQFPTDEMLAISRAIDQAQEGLLLKQEA